MYDNPKFSHYVELLKEYGPITGYLYLMAEAKCLTAADVMLARELASDDEDSTVIRVVAGAVKPYDLAFVADEVLNAAAFDGNWERAR